MWGRIYPHVVLLIFTNIIFKVSCKGSASLTFLIDDTGSMTDDIRQVRSSVNRISDVVFNEKSSLIGNMVLVTFNDPDAAVRVITENRDTFKRTLDAVYAHNVYNRDCWEPSMNGLYLALDNSNKDSYIYVFTDAPARDYRDSHYIKEMCQKKQSQIVFVLTGRCSDIYEPEAFDVYFDIAHACSGLAFDVTKNDVEQVLRTIEETIRGNKTVITTTIVPPNVYKDIPFTIDDHTEYAIVSVSGKNVYLDIKGPSASLEKIMWNNNGKVAKLSNAKAGQYVATVMGQTRTSVIIVGRTDFFFSHGFSEQVPKSPGDTSLQPIADANVHLSISVTDDHHTVRIVGAQILDMDEKLIQDLPLKEISKDFYVTDSFVAPSQRFKVAVNGVVLATGKPIKRIAKIPVTPAEKPIKLPDNTKPTAEITEGKSIEIEYNSTVKLTCKVIAYPEPRISWISNSGNPMPSKTSLVEYPYIYISYMNTSNASKGDKYKCYAANDVGRDETSINVIVKEPFTVKSVPSGITKLVYGKEGTITCDVTSRLPMDIHWYYANEMTGQTKEIESSDKYEISKSRTQLKIRKMDLDLVGRYECKVFLTNKKDEKKSFFTRVKVDGLAAPKVQGATDLKVTKGNTAIFECKVVSGLPAPKITWLFGGKSGSTFTPLTGSKSVLRITNVEDKHEGKYKCVAENVLAKDEHVTTLFVQELPKIPSKSSIVYQATEGDSLLRIPCVATGAPKPVIIWKLSGRNITPSAKYSIEDGTLIIKDPKVSDTNSYTCEAKNDVGSVSATFKTYIRQAPHVSGVAAKKVKLGLPASVECSIDKGEPKPTITWQFMDNSGSKYSPIPVISDKVLIISKVENKHAGRYKCVAQNNVGNSEHITTIVVQDPPKIMSNNSIIYQITEGDALLRIPCVATGLPKPSITWKLNGHVINPTAKYSIEDGTLIIRDPKVTDTNSYTCEANNEVSSVSATFKAYIRQIPKLSGVASKNVRLGAPVKVECMIVKGEPKPTITWQYMENNASKFVPIAGGDNVLRITKAEKKQAGSYKCIAQNNVGKDEHVTTLVVEFAPAINKTTSAVEGMVGDLALRIPCDVVGIPLPVITWKLKGVTITSGSKYSIEDEALVIMKPTEKDTSLYTCEAKNYIDSDSASFQAVVETYPKFGTLHYVYIKVGETKKLDCEAYKSPSQSIKWFSDAANDNIKKTYAHIVKASYSDDGNYTCHVSDKHGYTQTHTYVVDVGKEPQLYEEVSLKNWRGVVTDIMQNCDSKSTKPIPDVEWTYNGKPLTDFNSAGLGHYTCNVSNVHGSVQRSFDVKSSACLITRNLKDAQYMPLVLNNEGYWHKLETTKHYTVIEQEDKITLTCPSRKDTTNTFKNFPNKSKLEAYCYKEDTFLVEGKKYKLADLQCSNGIEPSVIRKKEKCSTETSELIRVGYKVSGFLETYEVCFDHAINLPVYTRARISSSDNSLSTDYNWFNYPGIGDKKTEEAFTCKDKLSSCCYSKSQLVNAMDFNDGPAKKSTFIDPLNVVPVWLPCNTSKTTWNNINDMVRSQLNVYTDIVAWSGTHTLQKKHGASIPRYLWKVLKFDSEESMAIVHVNDPTPTDKDIKCKNICTKDDDWFTVSDKYTYCCSLPDFLKAFDIRDTDMEESMDEILNKIERST